MPNVAIRPGPRASLAIAWLSAILAVPAAAVETVDLERLPWRAVAPGKLGINLNYLLDGAVPEAGLTGSLAATGVRWLRYPGGEKSDNHLWSDPPFTGPAPRAALVGANSWPGADQRFFVQGDGRTWAVDPLDVDEFMRICAATGAQPVMVVAQGAAAVPAEAGQGAVDEAALIAAARALVRYCRQRGFQVRHWEIGNEPYLDRHQSASAYAASWARFAAAMTAEDPAIRLGVNGPDTATFVHKDHPADGPWWAAFLRSAGRAPDWISLHDYPCYHWQGFATYAQRGVAALPGLDGVLAAVGGTPEVLVTEANSADWYGHPKQLGWKHASSLAHGVVLFDLLGQYLLEPRLSGAMVWNTRWLGNAAAPELWDAYGPDDRLLPTGQALALWHRRMPAELAVVPAPSGLRIYAGRGGAAGAGTLWIINRTLASIDLALPQARGPVTAWSGTSPDDPAPALAETPAAAAVTVPAHGVAVVGLEALP